MPTCLVVLPACSSDHLRRLLPPPPHSPPRSDHIVLEDLEQFLDEKDAKQAMDYLDDDANGQVNVQECCAAIARMFVDRKNLAASLKDARTIVGKVGGGSVLSGWIVGGWCGVWGHLTQQKERCSPFGCRCCALMQVCLRAPHVPQAPHRAPSPSPAPPWLNSWRR